MHAIWTLPEGDADDPSRWHTIKDLFSRRLNPDERLSKSRIPQGERGIWQRRYFPTHRHVLTFIDATERKANRHAPYPSPAAATSSPSTRPIAAHPSRPTPSTTSAAPYDARTLAPLNIDAWVVLPNHMHAIWPLPEADEDDPHRWRTIKNVFSRRQDPDKTLYTSPAA